MKKYKVIAMHIDQELINCVAPISEMVGTNDQIDIKQDCIN